MKNAALAILLLLICPAVTVADWDISALIAAGDGGNEHPTTPTRPTASSIETTMGDANFLEDVAALALTRDGDYGPWIAPTDFGAVGRTVAGAAVDEHSYIAWCTWIGRYAADAVGRSTPFSVNCSLAGGYTINGYIEIQTDQTVYGGFQFTSATTHNGGQMESPGYTTFHHIADSVDVVTTGNPVTGTDYYPAIVGANNAERISLVDVEIDGHVYDLYSGAPAPGVLNDWVRPRFPPAAGANFTADGSTDIITSASHPLDDVSAIVLTTTDTLPTGLSTATTYRVLKIDGDSFQLSSTEGGDPIDFTGAGSGTHSWVPKFSDVALSQKLRQSPAWCGFSTIGQSGRTQPRYVTLERVYIHDTWGTCCFITGSINAGTGRLAFGNTVSGRPLYRCRSPNGLERLDLFGFVRSSHCRFNGPSVINYLHATVTGPFGNGFGGESNPWDENPEGIQGSLAFFAGNLRTDNSVGYVSTPGSQEIRILDSFVDGEGAVPLAFQTNVDLYVRGTVTDCDTAFDIHPTFPSSSSTGTGVARPINLDVELTTVNSGSPQFTGALSRGMAKGRVVLNNSTTSAWRIEQWGSDVLAADLDLDPNDGSGPSYATINSNALTPVLLGVNKARDADGNSLVPTDYVQDLYIEWNSDWYVPVLIQIDDLINDVQDFTVDTGADTIVDVAHGLENDTVVWFASSGTIPTGLSVTKPFYVVQKSDDAYKVSQTLGGDPVDIGTGSGTHRWIYPIPVEDCVPTRIRLRTNTRNFLAKWFALRTTTTSRDDIGNALRHYPIEIILEHPGTQTWDTVSPAAFLGDYAHTVHNQIYTVEDYTQDPTQYRRVFVVTTDDVDEANDNMEAAGRGRPFNVQLEKAGPVLYWAAVLVVGDRDIDEYQNAVDGGIEEEIDVDAVANPEKPDAYRRAIAAAGYTIRS